MSRDLERVSHFAHRLVAGSLRLCKRKAYEQNRLIQQIAVRCLHSFIACVGTQI